MLVLLVILRYAGAQLVVYALTESGDSFHKVAGGERVYHAQYHNSDQENHGDGRWSNVERSRFGDACQMR